uniref:RING-type domain-containing protein n=1 Tax=Steinernema glaseri TaxID=37863 RepID=A0A1I8AU15_9BILA
MSQHSEARWADSSEYSSNEETDLCTPQLSSVSSSFFSSVDSEDGSMCVMAETLACDGQCRQLMEVQALKAFDCGHVFCVDCLPDKTEEALDKKCPAKNCVQRSYFNNPQWSEVVTAKEVSSGLKNMSSSLPTALSSLSLCETPLSYTSSSASEARSSSSGTSGTSTSSNACSSTDSSTSYCSSCATSCFLSSASRFSSTFASRLSLPSTATASSTSLDLVTGCELSEGSTS